jgi:hypothetical protein
MDVSQRGDDFTAPDFQFVALPELSGGGTKYDNSLEGYYQSLSKPKKDYLQELFYKQMKAMGGQRQLYEAVMNDPNRPSPHPSWREVRAWHAAQRVNALSRPANKSSKSLANPVVRSKLAPCARLGFDSVVMQAASAKKDATKMGDQGFKGFLNIVDQATRMSWVNLLRVIGQPDDCLSAAIQMIRAVRQSYYNDPESDRWPVSKTLCVTDSGKEFSQTFRTGFAAELGPQVEVKWQTVPAGNPNAGASQVENSNKQARGILRKIAQANRTTNQNDGKQKDWRSYWVGPSQIYFKQLQKLINERFDASIDRIQPIKLWDAYRVPSAANRDLIKKSQNAMKGEANKRRGPSHLKPENYFKIGDIVRRINTQWAGKSGTIRSNALKQGNRWTLGQYSIYSVRTYAEAPPTYELVLVDDGRGGNPPQPPSDFKTRRDYQGVLVSVNRFRHSDLNRVIGDEDAPQAMMDNDVPPEQRWRRGDRLRVAWTRIRLVGANQDTLTVVYANLGDRDDIEEVKFDTTRWANGTVRRYNAGQQGRPGSINVDFDDGTDNVRISFYDQSVNHVEPAFIERI